ncbi:MAG: trypsin-like peptidase domain-containing protein [Sedimentisphaerales bacterium]|nr:trypsin-like peptidase domain-containing protein [Sedimentisphaerales bacterium]
MDEAKKLLEEAKTRSVLEHKQPAPLPLPPPEDVYAKCSGSVLVVRWGSQEYGAAGSGFILSEGLVITNAHVIKGASSVTLRSKNGQVACVSTARAIDEFRDIAVLPLPDGFHLLPGLALAAAEPKVGEAVYALGAPRSLEYTFSRGVVSQLRKLDGSPLFVQTDAPVSSGSSGGPLLNAKGEVVGIVTCSLVAIADANDLNFAVACTELAAVLQGAGKFKPLVEYPSYLTSLAERKKGEKDKQARETALAKAREAQARAKAEAEYAAFARELERRTEEARLRQAEEDRARAIEAARIRQQQEAEARARYVEVMRPRWRLLVRGIKTGQVRQLLGEPLRISNVGGYQAWSYPLGGVVIFQPDLQPTGRGWSYPTGDGNVSSWTEPVW